MEKIYAKTNRIEEKKLSR